MTIVGWCLFGFIASCIAVGGIVLAIYCESIPGRILSGLVAIILIIALLIGMKWYYANTASGQRALKWWTSWKIQSVETMALGAQEYEHRR